MALQAEAPAGRPRPDVPGEACACQGLIKSIGVSNYTVEDATDVRAEEKGVVPGARTCQSFRLQNFLSQQSIRSSEALGRATHRRCFPVAKPVPQGLTRFCTGRSRFLRHYRAGCKEAKRSCLGHVPGPSRISRDSAYNCRPRMLRFLKESPKSPSQEHRSRAFAACFVSLWQGLPSTLQLWQGGLARERGHSALSDEGPSQLPMCYDPTAIPYSRGLRVKF